MKTLKLLPIALLAPLLVIGGCSIQDTVAESPQDLPVTDLSPIPLEEETTLKVSSVGNFEFLTALLVADALGEFEKENIAIEYVTLPASDAVPALALGQVDVAAIGITAPFFNAVAEGADLRIVFPGPSSPNGDGLWVRTEVLGLENKQSISIGNSRGAAWLGIVPVTQYLEQIDVDIDSVEFTSIPISELATALELGAVDGAWLNSPSHLPFENSTEVKRVIGYAENQIGTGYAFGPRLLDEDPLLGKAFIRAMLRTVENHLSGDYKSDVEIRVELVEKLGIDESRLDISGNLAFPTRLDTSLLTEAQELWIQIGGIVPYDEPLPSSSYIEERFVDSFE